MSGNYNGSDSSGDDDVQEILFTSSGKAGSKQGTSGQEGENVPRETSPDLFDSQEEGTTSGTNSENWSQWDKVEAGIPTGKPDEGEGGVETRGVLMEKLKRAPRCLGNLGKLMPTETHCVMVRLPFTYKEDQLPHPHPVHFLDKWDGDHVRMPCSNWNEYPAPDMERMLGVSGLEQRETDLSANSHKHSGHMNREPEKTHPEPKAVDWELERSDLVLEKKLGEGCFGEVWKGKWRNVKDVAIKMMKVGSMSVKAFRDEAQIMKSCHHEHLVCLFGICSREEPIYIITELMTNGSLLEYLREGAGRTASVDVLIYMAEQVASGMAFLEKKHVVHRDLAARNVLVGEKNVVKVTDFGLARALAEGNSAYMPSNPKSPFPFKWTAPEAALFSRFTIKSDVWSYGILLHELMTRGENPYPGMANLEVLEHLKRGYRMPRAKECPKPVYEVMLKCWEREPNKRPTFKGLRDFFYYEGKTGVPKWKVIRDALRAYIPGPYELEETILKYNQRYEKKWSFETLQYFLTEYCTPEERNKFFDDTLPKIAKLALQLPHLCTSPIPLLKRPMDDWGSKGKEDKGKTARPRPNTITMSQQQVACLLANAFFCTFPRRNAMQAQSEYSAYPSINFNTLYGGEPTSRKMEKLKCIVHYFERITEKMPAGLVTFTRQHIRKMPNWGELDINLSELHVSSGGTIEDDGLGMLQVDFASKFIGGGALCEDLQQEQIRFMICPEMIVTRLFTEVLDKHESVIMTGCERFSNYSGHSDSFQWSGNHVDKTERDSWGRLCCEVVAIDALVFTYYGSHFSSCNVRRELNKAYAGFWSPRPRTELSAVCTGNWGCGAFGGDEQLKALIQLMAAACAKRDVCYFTFGNKELVQELFSIHSFLTQENPLAIGNIMRMIEQYDNGVVSKSWQKPTLKLFDFIIRHFEDPGGSPTTEEEWSNSSEERVLMSEKERKAADEAKSIHAAPH